MLHRLIRTVSRAEGGFTLIELMIVILVILILAAILVPQFGLARERARKASCVSNQRNIETAVSMWATDNLSTPYVQGVMTPGTSTPDYSALTGSPQYILVGAFQEPDDPNAANANGPDYYLSAGGGGGSPAAPSYGHVACAYAQDSGTACGNGDPWINCYNGVGAGTGLNHARGATASP